MPKIAGPLKREERRSKVKDDDEDDDEEDERLEVGEKLDVELEDTDPEDNWIFPREPVTREEKKKLFGKVLEVLVKTTFANHIYSYRNKLYKQMNGGAIGLRLTGVVARLVMDKWAQLFMERMTQAEIIVYLIKKYVDDVNICMEMIEPGWSWTKQKTGLPVLEWTKEMETEDKKLEVSPEELTMRKVQELASILIEGIKFTVDLPEKHETRKVPMLDLCVWLDDCGDVKIIRHGFYEKPTTSPLVFHGRGACSIKQKITIPSEEVKRRMLNLDTRHSEEERETVLKGFSQKLIDSSYTREVRKEIL